MESLQRVQGWTVETPPPVRSDPRVDRSDPHLARSATHLARDPRESQPQGGVTALVCDH